MIDPVSSGVALSLENVSKSYPGVRALTDVSLQVRAGEVHAVVGENGAGKSTLMSIASGSVGPDTGSVHIQGSPMTTASPRFAQAMGLAIVQQHPALLPQLTVTENFDLVRGVRWIKSIRESRRWANRWLLPWQLDIDPRDRVEDLSVEQRQVLEIARALSTEPKVLILDEPTEHLNAEESERLFAQIRKLVAGGGSAVYISHRIPEVKSIATRITVLRDGKVRGTYSAEDVDEDTIISLVVGRELDAAFPPKGSIASITGGGLEVSNFRGDGFGAVDLHVKQGEVVGIAGVQGNGQEDFIRSVAGLSAADGTLRVNDVSVRTGSRSASAAAGIAFLPSDRHEEGVFSALSVEDNIVIGELSQASVAGVVRAGRVRQLASDAAQRFAVKTPSLKTPVSSLSGGNQQKVLFSRTSLSRPRVLLAAEPTQGVDAGARVEIYNVIRQAADDGAAVVVLSSDNLELAGLCDRVAIFSRGHIVTELAGDALGEEAITAASLRSTSIRDRVAARRGRAKLPRWMRGDYAAAMILALLVLLLGAYVATQNEFYLTARNMTGLLALLAPLVLIAVAQQTVMLGGGIDLSVGPLSGLLLVVSSFFILDGSSTGLMVLGFVLLVVIAIAVGGTNGGLVQSMKVPAVIATLAMFMLLRGISLTLRERPEGSINADVVKTLGAKVGPVPVAIIVAIAIVLILELCLRRSRVGMSLRAIGSNQDAASRMGIRVGRVRFWSFVVTSLMVVPVTLLLMVQVGIGDPATGVTYTLASLTAVVLGGARVMGGRGSYIGAFFGALLIMQVTNVTTFLQLGQAWQYWLMGLLLLGSTVLFARVRRTGA